MPKAYHRFCLTDLSEFLSSQGNCSESCSVLSNSLWLHGLYCPWNSPGQNTGVSNLSLLQGIFLTQGSNPGLLHCRQMLYHLSHQGKSGKHRFKSVIFQIETIKVISIFTSSFSPFLNLCEVIRFSIRFLTQLRNWYLSKILFYKSSWRGSIFVKLVSAMTIFWDSN